MCHFLAYLIQPQLQLLGEICHWLELDIRDVTQLPWRAHTILYHSFLDFSALRPFNGCFSPLNACTLFRILLIFQTKKWVCQWRCLMGRSCSLVPQHLLGM